MPATPKQPKARAETSDIIRLNSVGLSLSAISKLLNCHHTTVAARLAIHGVEAADTRRSFMEDIYWGLSEPQRKWLTDQLSPTHTIKDYVKGLLIKEFMHARNSNQKEELDVAA